MNPIYWNTISCIVYAVINTCVCVDAEIWPIALLWFLTLMTSITGGLHMAYNYNWMMISFCVCLITLVSSISTGRVPSLLRGFLGNGIVHVNLPPEACCTLNSAASMQSTSGLGRAKRTCTWNLCLFVYQL